MTSPHYPVSSRAASPHTTRRSLHHPSPSQQTTTFTPFTAATEGSPAPSILLPPVEIPESPAHSYRSSVSYFTDASHRGHYPESERHSDYDDNDNSDCGQTRRNNMERDAREFDSSHKVPQQEGEKRGIGHLRTRDYCSTGRANTAWSEDAARPQNTAGITRSISFSGADYSLKDSTHDYYSERDTTDRIAQRSTFAKGHMASAITGTLGNSSLTIVGGGGGNVPSSWSSGGLRKSVSTRSISVRRKSWFARMRRSPSFILFTVFLTLFADMTTYGIIVPIIPFIVSDRIQGDATHTGLLLGIYAIGMLVASPLFGMISDRFVSRRVPMLIGLVVMLASTFLFMLASNFCVLLIARLLQGVAGGSVWTLGLALISDIYPAEAIGVQMGKVLIGYTLGLMMGPPLGGILYDFGGYRAPFYFCCGITIVDIVCRSLVIEEREEIVRALHLLGKQKEAVEEAEVVKAQRKLERLMAQSSWWQLLQNKRLVACIIVTACSSFVFSGAEPTVPLHLASKFHLSSEQIGLVFLAISLPTITGPISGAIADRLGAKVIVLVSLVLCAAGIALVGFFQDSLTLTVVLFTGLGTTGTAVLTPILGEISAVVRQSGSDSFARAYAMFNMAFSIGVLIGPVACGVIYERYGFQVMTLAMMTALLAAVPVVALWVGGLAQKQRDIAKYREEEERRRAWREQGQRHGASVSSLTKSFSKYSLELADEDAVLCDDSPMVVTTNQQTFQQQYMDARDGDDVEKGFNAGAG